MSVTVCIPTIPSRRSLLSRCVWSIPAGVEILVADGAGPMGDKLNGCFAKASGSHVICVDDDDYLGELPTVGDVDFVGYRVLYTEDGRFGGSVAHRGDGDVSWATFDRGVSPKCPVRTEIARSHKFGNHYTADREWSEAVQADVSSHVFHDLHGYHYDHWDVHMVGTTPDAGMLDRPQRDIGVWPCDWDRVTWI